jgi:hypothetical protein
MSCDKELETIATDPQDFDYELDEEALAEWLADDRLMTNAPHFSDRRYKLSRYDVPGFCAGCGAHHVREAGRFLCEDCNEDFRDIS